MNTSNSHPTSSTMDDQSGAGNLANGQQQQQQSQQSSSSQQQTQPSQQRQTPPSCGAGGGTPQPGHHQPPPPPQLQPPPPQGHPPPPPPPPPPPQQQQQQGQGQQQQQPPPPQQQQGQSSNQPQDEGHGQQQQQNQLHAQQGHSGPQHPGAQQGGPPPPQQQEPVNFNPSQGPHGRRVTIGGVHGSNQGVERRNSLASVGLMDDLLGGRRPSVGFDVNMDIFGRRESIDSTTAALDAAILDLTRRRSSMALGRQYSIGGLAPPMTSSDMPSQGPHNMGPNNSFGGFNPPPSMNMGMNQLPPPPQSSNQQNTVSSIAARQQQLQQQQRELEQRQKELEIQRQHLLAGMQERSYSQTVPNPPSIMNGHSSSLGYGSFHSGSGSIGFGGPSGGSLGLGSIHSHGSHGSLPVGQQHRPSVSSSGSQQWWICQVCNSKAFASHEEAMAHEATCQQGPRGSMHPMPYPPHNDIGPRFSLGMDSSTHSSYDNNAAGSMSSGPFAMLSAPMPLAMPSDKDWLTPLHCFVRRHCVEIFSASDQDVATPSKGKRKPIQVGQIGIRCPHCHIYDSSSASKARERGSVYYPTTISSIYNATMNLLQRHLHSCPHVPDDIMRRYETLKADDARSGTSKRYWVESALSLGLVDTPNGIRYSALRPPPLPSLTRQQECTGQNAARRNSNEFFGSESNAISDIKGSMQKEGGEAAEVTANETIPKAEQDMAQTAPLVTPDDKPYATAFSYHLLSQMQPCVFTEADRLGKRKGLPPGFPGLACRHCFGGYGSGRFFPSSIKTLSDTSKTLNVLHNHMMRCRKCPTDVRETLEKLRGSHDEERAKMKFGSQKAFFARIWERLHGKGKPPSLKRSLEPPMSHTSNNMSKPLQPGIDHHHLHHQQGYGPPPPLTGAPMPPQHHGAPMPHPCEPHQQHHHPHPAHHHDSHLSQPPPASMVQGGMDPMGGSSSNKRQKMNL